MMSTVTYLYILQIISVVSELLSTRQKNKGNKLLYSWFLPVLNVVSDRSPLFIHLMGCSVFFSSVDLVVVGINGYLLGICYLDIQHTIFFFRAIRVSCLFIPLQASADVIMIK